MTASESSTNTQTTSGNRAVAAAPVERAVIGPEAANLLSTSVAELAANHFDSMSLGHGVRT